MKIIIYVYNYIQHALLFGCFDLSDSMISISFLLFDDCFFFFFKGIVSISLIICKDCIGLY